MGVELAFNGGFETLPSSAVPIVSSSAAGHVEVRYREIAVKERTLCKSGQ